MTRKQFVEYLKEQQGATFATLTALVEPTIKSPKTSGMAGRIKKRSRINCTLNFIYGNSVNRQREREDKVADFTPNPRKWGQRIQGTTLVEHKGKVYVEAKVEKVYDTEYLLDNEPVSYEKIAEFLRPKSSKSRQGTDKQVILRDYNVENITEVNMNRDKLTLCGSVV